MFITRYLAGGKAAGRNVEVTASVLLSNGTVVEVHLMYIFV